ncbi:unnamed protein product [Adineta steineri]|uniref:Protein JTB n=1 Tax=Adineta steineri TaxID=433720 RepID=A0A814RQD5_9BILA|nr:unnamed protein product [Adineta steineri]CAF1392111.1 unnamed protein product [Adineta steineri]CAF1520553.1 unnamed protein product [Adineta steineri]
MFDFITRRRLIIFLAAILFVTISILFIVHIRSTTISQIIPSFTPTSSSINSTDEEKSTDKCYLNEPFDVLTSCRRCRSYEQRAHATDCLPTGYREFVFCSKSNIKVYRPCAIPIRIQKERFWYFEGIVFIIALLSTTSVYLRQKSLNKQMVEKIKRQIEISEE